MSLLYLITSCERPEMAMRLIRQIQKQSPLPFKICLIDHNSEADYSPVENVLKSTGGIYHKFGIPQGKKEYWRVMSRLFQTAQQIDFDYVYKFDDDVELHPQALEKSLHLFKIISQYRNKRVLNMWVDHRATEKVWTSTPPKVEHINGIEVRRVGWIDGGNWMTNRRVLDILDWQCPQPPDSWWESPWDSSGVGKYLSIELQRTACKIYMPLEPLIFHGSHLSQMHAHIKDRLIQMETKPW